MPKTLQDKDRKEVHPSRNQCWRCSRVLAAELLREASVPGDLELLIPRLCLVWKSHVQYPHGLLATLNNLYLSAQQGSCGSRSKSSLSSVIPADFDAVWSRPAGPVWELKEAAQAGCPSVTSSPSSCSWAGQLHPSPGESTMWKATWSIHWSHFSTLHDCRGLSRTHPAWPSSRRHAQLLVFHSA